MDGGMDGYNIMWFVAVVIGTMVLGAAIAYGIHAFPRPDPARAAWAGEARTREIYRTEDPRLREALTPAGRGTEAHACERLRQNPGSPVSGPGFFFVAGVALSGGCRSRRTPQPFISSSPALKLTTDWARIPIDRSLPELDHPVKIGPLDQAAGNEEKGESHVHRHQGRHDRHG